MIGFLTKSIFRLIKLTLIILIAVFIYTTVKGMPPYPATLDKEKTDRVSLEQTRNLLNDMHERGIDTPSDFFSRFLDRNKALPENAASSRTFRILAILVDFSDQEAQVEPEFFDSLIFDTTGQTIKNYFNEATRTQIDLVTATLPSEMGWNRAPSTYSYYTDNNYGTGSYPRNAQKLVENAVDMVDDRVDFLDYDNDRDGYVDVLLVIHSGTGAEFTRDPDDIWSHKWAIDARYRDGVYIRDYTIQPEFWVNPGDMTIGVYSHELSHGFGLPDLYDIDNSSYGIGKWGIMGFGSWNGPNNRGGSPAHHCAWSKMKMGVVDVVDITEDKMNFAIDPVATTGQVFRLKTSEMTLDEYFLIENRQEIGSDEYLPGSGLLIWHIDEAKSNNKQEWITGERLDKHYLVALEQADGRFDLENLNNYGDGSDPFPGRLNTTNFNYASEPSSKTYLNRESNVAIENIDESGETIYADIMIDPGALQTSPDDPLTPSEINLSQNYPNPFNPSTRIRFSVSAPTHARLEVYNTLGQKVCTILDEDVGTGSTTVQWLGTNEYGYKAASGIYYYRLTTGSKTITKKMLLIR